MKKIALIVAGGSGQRMNSAVPKQFLPLAGKPVLMHTLGKFYRFDSEIELRLVLPATEMETWQNLCNKHNFTLPVATFCGGHTRYHSVKNGLEGINTESLVAVHDGVRPLVSEATIAQCFEQAELHGAVIPVTPVNESIRRLTPDHSIALDRSMFRLVQTPQVFQSKILLQAYQSEYRDTFTDDASVVEHAGHHVHLVNGNNENIKITTPQDLLLAENLLQDS